MKHLKYYWRQFLSIHPFYAIKRKKRKGNLKSWINLSLFRIKTRHMSCGAMVALLWVVVSAIVAVSLLFTANTTAYVIVVIVRHSHCIVVNIEWCHHLTENKILDIGLVFFYMFIKYTISKQKLSKKFGNFWKKFTFCR